MSAVHVNSKSELATGALLFFATTDIVNTSDSTLVSSSSHVSVKTKSSAPYIILLVFRLDVYRKIPKDLTQPTFAGAFISICSILFIAFLFLSELHSFLTPEM